MGYALAGHLLEVRSGEAFGAFVTRRLFAPLGMDHSAWSLAALPEPAALPYRRTAVGFEAIEPYGAPFVPAVLLRTSARDLGRFLAFHLANGRVGEQQVVPAAAIAEMQRIQFPLSGLQALGWRYLNAGRGLVLGHGGSGSGVTAEIVIDLRRHRGVALLTNVDATSGDAGRAFQAILGRLLEESEFPVVEPPRPEPREWLLPAVIRGRRGGSAEYRTDLWLINPTAQPLPVELAFRPRGAGPEPPPLAIVLAAGEGREFVDVLGDAFSLVGAQGTLAVTVPPGERATPAVSAVARLTSSRGPSEWLTAEERVAAGERWLAGVHQGDGFDATVALQNGEDTEQTVVLEAWDAGGHSLGAIAVGLGARAFRSQRLDALFPATSRGGGPFALHFSAAGKFLASATLLVAGSGDALHVPAHSAATGAVLLPRAVRGRGQRDATLVTELVLHNPSDGAATVHLELRRRGSAAGPATAASVHLPPRASRAFGDVLRELFAVSGDAAGAVTITVEGEGTVPIVSAVSFVTRADGERLGAAVPLETTGGGELRRVFGAGWGAGRDTSVGLVNPAAEPVSVALELLDQQGKSRGRRVVMLAARQHLERTLPGLFGPLEPVRGATVTARASGGGVTLYLSSLDEVGDLDLLLAEDGVE